MVLIIDLGQAKQKLALDEFHEKVRARLCRPSGDIRMKVGSFNQIKYCGVCQQRLTTAGKSMDRLINHVLGKA